MQLPLHLPRPVLSQVPSGLLGSPLSLSFTPSFSSSPLDLPLSLSLPLSQQPEWARCRILWPVSYQPARLRCPLASAIASRDGEEEEVVMHGGGYAIKGVTIYDVR